MKIWIFSRRGTQINNILENYCKEFNLQIINFEKYFHNKIGNKKDLISLNGYNYIEEQQSFLFKEIITKNNILLYTNDLIFLNEYIESSYYIKFDKVFFYKQDTIQCWLNFIAKQEYIPFKEYQQHIFNVNYYLNNVNWIKIINI